MPTNFSSSSSKLISKFRLVCSPAAPMAFRRAETAPWATAAKNELKLSCCWFAVGKPVRSLISFLAAAMA